MMDEEELTDDKGRPLVFYYSREERLKKASQAVRDFNTASPPRKVSLIRTLTATKPLTFLFISIVILCAMFLAYSRFSPDGKVLGNNTVSVTAVTGEDKSFITIKKTASMNAYTGAVDVAVSPAFEALPGEGKSMEGKSMEGKDFPIEAQRFYFSPDPEEVFRFSAPFTGKKFIVLMEAKEERVLFRITAK